MEDADLHRLRSTALFAVADVRRSGITAPLVARAMERELRLPGAGFQVAPSSFPRADFLVSFDRRSDRDAALEQHSFPVRGVHFTLLPWVPPANGHPVRRCYCRLALEPLPLRAWEWDVVAAMLGADCELDRIEQQCSVTRRSGDVLFVWAWAWSPDDIPRTSELNLRNRPGKLTPEGIPEDEGEEGSVIEVLIHLDQVQDFTYPPERTTAGKTPEGDEGSVTKVLIRLDQVHVYTPIARPW
jgi:hypothetical protein